MRLSKSIVGQKEVDAVSKVILDDGYLGMGAEVGMFEQEIAQYLTVPHQNVVCINSGTAALHLAVDAITNPGDEILVPSLTFLSSFQAISASGAIPVSCEVLEDTLTIDLNDAESRITPKTKAIMAVHYASNLVDHEQLYSLAKKYNLRVIEDAAHAFGCEYRNEKIGSIGDIICFSFDGIKNITSGEGGAIVTTDETVLNIVKDTRLLGIEKDSEKRYAGARSWDFNVTRQGFRYHMSNIFAAIGRVQLSRFESEFAPKRMQLCKTYLNSLGNLEDIVMLAYDPNSKIIPHIFPIRIIKNRRDGLKTYLEENGVPTGIHYKPNHLLGFYNTGITLPKTERIYTEILTLPLHPDLETADVIYICNLIRDFLNKI
jgi:dTDP-4-amino-4,6-dideoxygalactose transaminase